MIIPKKIKIGAITYKVRIVEHWDGDEDADGECFYDGPYKNTIFIKKSLTPEARDITFIHEALHAMNSIMDHYFLDSLSEQLYQFLYDNKLLK